MVVTILVESTGNDGFRAICGDPVHLEADAATKVEAVEKLRQLLADRLSKGAEVVDIEVGPASHPVAEYVGMLEGDPMLDEWKSAMDEYRSDRQREAEAP